MGTSVGPALSSESSFVFKVWSGPDRLIQDIGGVSRKDGKNALFFWWFLMPKSVNKLDKLVASYCRPADLRLGTRFRWSSLRFRSETQLAHFGPRQGVRTDSKHRVQRESTDLLLILISFRTRPAWSCDGATFLASLSSLLFTGASVL